ncbi:MAG: hypothetical protein JSU94_12485 [Phycisphaerales bacterium]|nr:MAG: hypothetical protein JSU94_12485 [Phycisphaerales bacterium]
MNGLIVTALVLVCGAAGIGAPEAEAESELAANQAEFENDRARIVVSIQSNIYTYDVTNLGESEITGFEVTQHAAYNFKAPEGWQIDISKHLFKATADAPPAGIQPGRTGRFSMRVSSEGAVLGRGTVKLIAESGEAALLEDVLVPVGEPSSHVLIVAAAILFIVVGHSVFLALRKRRAHKSPVRV